MSGDLVAFLGVSGLGEAVAAAAGIGAFVLGLGISLLSLPTAARGCLLAAVTSFALSFLFLYVLFVRDPYWYAWAVIIGAGAVGWSLGFVPVALVRVFRRFAEKVSRTLASGRA